ncbi:MAG: putative carbamoyl transferase, NodU family [Acidobacteria bacterium]|nr:putative carbamoyl transferase, NodU family [Acidobacteriota bacterium]
MLFLGISAFYHDAAAAMIRDDEILAAAQEERFTRKKHDPDFPHHAVRYCLQEAGATLQDLDAVVFYDKPFLKFERLLETYYAFAPDGLHSFLASMPVWIKEKIMLKKLLADELSKTGNGDTKTPTFLFPEHHLSHAASAFYPSPFEEAAILTIDGVGEWATASICHGKGKDITILQELKFPHSVGLLYSAFTYYLGFRVNSGEYKLMGLAPYGNAGSERVARFEDLIRRHIVHLKEDGSIWLNQELFDYSTGLKMVKDDKWEQIFGFPVRDPEGDLSPEHCDLALAIQRITEQIVFNMAKEARRLTGSRRLCLAGGVALNCVANGRLLKTGVYDDIWIQPAAGDAGGALGAAFCALYIHSGRERVVDRGDRMKGALLGPEFSDAEIQATVKKFGAVCQVYPDFDDVAAKTAELLDTGNVVGWFQGRMEFGPRALGGRSILADARNPEMQKKLNLKIKYREGFRPFAPSVLQEDVSDYFDLDRESPYMLLIADVKLSRRSILPQQYQDWSWRDKLYFLRSDVPAITHIDYSARIQTVDRKVNPRFWTLIQRFKERTGYGVIINTSFNVRGEPIVCTPEDAYKCFMRTEMDYLVMGNCLYAKGDQPTWTEEGNWKDRRGLD